MKSGIIAALAMGLVLVACHDDDSPSDPGGCGGLAEVWSCHSNEWELLTPACPISCAGDRLAPTPPCHDGAAYTRKCGG